MLGSTLVLVLNKLSEIPEYAEMQFHMMTTLWLDFDVT